MPHGQKRGVAIIDSARRLEIPAEQEQLDTVLDFLFSNLLLAGCPEDDRNIIAIAAEEVFINIARYAYAPGTGHVTLLFSVYEKPRRAEISFIDCGHPYNPLEKPDPDVSGDADSRPVGGLGIYLVKLSMDDVRYSFQDGQNILTMCKKF